MDARVVSRLRYWPFVSLLLLTSMALLSCPFLPQLKMGISELHLSSESNHYEAVERIIHEGEGVNTVDKVGIDR